MNNKGLIRKILVYFVYTFLFCCFQVSFPDRISFGAQIADLMFVYVALVAYYFGLKDGIIVGLCVGILRETFAAPAIFNFSGETVTSFGIGILTMFLVAVFCSQVFTQHLHRKMTFAILSVATSTVIYKLFGHIFITLWTGLLSNSVYRLSLKEIFVDSVLVQLVLNVITALPLTLLLRFAGPYRMGINPALSDNEKGGNRSWLTI